MVAQDIVEAFLNAIGISQVSSLPGSLVYHLAVLFALEAGALFALGHVWRQRRWATFRQALAACAIFLIGLAALIFELLAGLGVADPLIVLAVPTRAASSLIILIVIWLLIFPEPQPLADAGIVGLVLLTLLGSGVSLALWLQEAGAAAAYFNTSLQDTIWHAAQAGVLALGCVLVLARRKSSWLIGLALLALLLIGHAIHLAFPLAANVAGAVRLAEILAMPMLAAVLYRRAHAIGPSPPVAATLELEPEPAEAPAEPPVEAEPPPAARPTPQTESKDLRGLLNPKAAVALASLNASASPDEIAQIITLAIAHTCRAEVCLLLTAPDETGYVSVITGYDLVREQFVPGISASIHDMPQTTIALGLGAITQLTPDSYAPELRLISSLVGAPQIGPTIIAPIRFDNGETAGVLVLIALYSLRPWDPQDLRLVEALMGPIADALGGDSKINRLLDELEQTQSAADSAEAERRLAREEADQLNLALEDAHTEAERLADEIRQIKMKIESQPGLADPAVLSAQLQAAQADADAAAARIRAQVEAEWQAKLDQAAEIHTELRQREADLVTQLEQLRGRAAATAEAEIELQVAKQEADNARQQVAELTARLEQAQASAAAQVATLTALQAELAQAKAAPPAEAPAVEPAAEAITTDQLSELAGQLELARTDLATRAAQAEALQAELSRARERARAAADFEIELQVARQEAAEARHREADLIARLESLRNAPPAAASDSELRAQLAEALARAQAAEDLENQLRSARDEARAAQSFIADLTSELSHARDRLRETAADTPDELKRELDDARARLQAAEALEHQLELARQEAAEARRALADAAAQPASARSTASMQPETAPDAEAARLQAQIIADLEAKLQKVSAQADEAQDRVAELMATHQLDYQFQQQIEAQLRKELELTRAQLRRASEGGAVMSEASTQSLGPLEVNLNEAQAALQAQAAELAEVREQLDRKERQLEKAQAVMASLNEQAQAAAEHQAEWTAALEEVARLRAELEAHEREIHVNTSALAEFARQTRTLTSTQKQLVDAESELSELRAQLHDLTNGSRLMNEVQRQLTTRELQLAEAQDALLAARRPAGEESAAPADVPAETAEVLASITQELRQPMSSIVGYSDLLLGETVGIIGALQRKFLERIKASIERMDVLLNELTRVTDIDTGNLHLARQTVDVVSIIEEAAQSCSAQLRAKGLNLRLDIAEKLPPVNADQDALRQILTNLLVNASSASAPEGDIAVQVRREGVGAQNGHAADECLFLAVRDSGGGIAPDDQPRVFSRIYRADAPLIAGLGDTGIGLSIAKALVEAHGGRIWLTSDVGQGSTFHVLLPLHNSDDSPVDLDPG